MPVVVLMHSSSEGSKAAPMGRRQFQRSSIAVSTGGRPSAPQTCSHGTATPAGSTAGLPEVSSTALEPGLSADAQGTEPPWM